VHGSSVGQTSQPEYSITMTNEKAVVLVTTGKQLNQGSSQRILYLSRGFLAGWKAVWKTGTSLKEDQ
jgi:hypothetical protein